MVYPRFGPDGARVGRESVVNLAQMAVGTAKIRWTTFLAAWVGRWEPVPSGQHYEWRARETAGTVHLSVAD
jgi:hypothetical protein